MDVAHKLIKRSNGNGVGVGEFSAVGLCSPHKPALINAGSIPAEGSTYEP